MTERWLPIPGYEGRYEVSDLGRVRSLRHRGHIRTIIKQPNLCNGYFIIQLHKDGVRERIRLNRMVLTVFRGPAPSPVMDGAHLNGDSLDNRLSNLAWKTKSENNLDRVTHGTWSNGSDKGRGRWDKK